MRRLATIPGVGGITAHAIVAAVGDGRQFGSARDFAAWAGLTPRQHASAGKRRDQGISRQGDIRLRKLFALGASTVMRNARVARRSRHPLAARHPGAPAGEGGGAGAGGQDRPHRLGGAGLGRSLPGTSRRRTAIAAARGQRAAGATTHPRRGKEQEAATAKWSGPGSGHSDPSSRLRARRNAGNPIRATHRGQRSSTASTGRIHDRSRPLCRKPPKTPCQPGAVHT